MGIPGMDADVVTSVVSAKVRAPQINALPLERLDALLARLWQHRLGLVIAPAGSGKTTLLARFASSADVPVAWYRAESWDARIQTFLAHLEASFAHALGQIPRGWTSVQAAVKAIESSSGERMVLVIDDLHTLQATEAEAALERLIDYTPRTLSILAASRFAPAFNLSRLRVSGALLEIASDDLRFRSWEVERLFRDFYREPLPPEELAELARRTEGWAAGLQLFHLATRGKTPRERRRLLDVLWGRSRLVHEYLTRNVLDQLPAELHRFLVSTCVLGRLSGPLCDRFLARNGSQDLLEELERRQIFTCALEDKGWYRYHEVLRSHLEELLVEELGQDALSAYFARAAESLESAGALSDALRAYARAEDWEAVDRLLDGQDEQLLEASAEWVDALPPAVVRDDPWLTLATARRQRDEGRWQYAVEAYQRAESTFGLSETAGVCRRERLALTALLEPAPVSATNWAGVLRKALAHEPLAIRREASELPEATGTLVAGLATLVAGHLGEARRMLARVAGSPNASPAVAAAASVAAGVTALLAGDLNGRLDLDQGVESAEHLGLGWLSRLGRAALVLNFDSDALAEATSIRLACERNGDTWGTAIIALLEGWGRLYGGELSTQPLEQAVAAFRHLEAGVLEAWARALLSLALARMGAPDARETALHAESFARYTGAVGACFFPYVALRDVHPERSGEYRVLVQSLHDDCQLPFPPSSANEPGVANRAVPQIGLRPSSRRHSLAIRCLGGFSIAIRGRLVDLGAVKPRARAVLRLLAIHAGCPVHRELLQEAFWPEADYETGSRNLHVAISSLRRALEPGIARGASSLLLREGDAYRLSLPQDARVDVLEFERALVAGRVSRKQGDVEAATNYFRQVIAVNSGELLPEDGPAEWVVESRERYRGGFLEATQALAELLLSTGDASGAAQACTAGLYVDRYHDPLWRILIEARGRAGDQGAATRARMDYGKVLAELGLTELAAEMPQPRALSLRSEHVALSGFPASPAMP